MLMWDLKNVLESYSCSYKNVWDKGRMGQREKRNSGAKVMKASVNPTGCSGARNGPSKLSLIEAGAKPLISQALATSLLC